MNVDFSLLCYPLTRMDSISYYKGSSFIVLRKYVVLKMIKLEYSNSTESIFLWYV